MKKVSLSPQEKVKMRNGESFVLTYQGKDYLITPPLYAYAKEAMEAGATEIVVFPEVVGNGMEQVTVTR